MKIRKKSLHEKIQRGAPGSTSHRKSSRAEDARKGRYKKQRTRTTGNLAQDNEVRWDNDPPNKPKFTGNTSEKVPTNETAISEISPECSPNLFLGKVRLWPLGKGVHVIVCLFW